MSTPGKRKRWARKRAISSSVSLVRMGRLEALALLHQALEALAVARLDVDQLGQLVDGLLQVAHLGGVISSV
jgi:hypothetical protein